MPEDGSNEEQTFKQFQLGGPDTEPVNIPDEDAGIGEAINTFNELHEARRTARLPENEESVGALEEGLREGKEGLQRTVASSLLSEILEGLSADLEERGEITDEDELDAFRASRLFTIEDGTLRYSNEAEEKVEEWTEDAPPEPLLNTAGDIIEGLQLDKWAEWAASHVLYWAARDLNRDIEEGDETPEQVSDEEWGRRFNELLASEERGYMEDALQILGAELADLAAEGLRDATEDGRLSLAQVEGMLGLGEPADGAPAPRPETEEMDPDPFQGDPPMTSLLADPFSTTAIDVLREAEGEPAPTYEGEWGEDSTGHPIRVEQLGNPYEGRATFKVQAFGEPDPTAVEASMGWKMLDRMDMDTVWLHLLLLGYASATHRRGDRPVIRIPRRTVEKVFGYRNDNYTMEERAKKIRRHVEALQSIFVQFQEVQRHGDKLHFRSDMTSGAPLWGLRMVAKGQQDLFTGETVADWHLEAREGMWAEEFLHSHGGQWAQLPKEWFEQIDRRGSRNFAQRLAVYLLFQFRINAENDNRVTKQAQTLLEVCGEDMSEPRSSKRRSELKRCLSNALDTLERDYGIEVHAGRVHMDETKGMDFDTWKKRAAAFDPPQAMDGRLFQNAEGEAPPLPDIAGDWKPKQIRHLRTEVLDETQPELGDRLDVSKQYVSQLERGTSEPSARVRKVLDGLQARHE
jgi:hypothetical protein